jgi:hypothetical protein
MSNQHDYEAAMAEVKQDLIADLQREQRQEIVRQDAKWGDQTGMRNGTGGPLLRMLSNAVRELTQSLAAHGQCTWLNVLEEEEREAFAEDDPVRIYEELVQVEAVSMQWRIALLKQIAAGRTPDQDAAEEIMERGFRSILNALAEHPLVAEVHYKDMSDRLTGLPDADDYPGASRLAGLPDGQITGILNPDTLWQGQPGWGEIFRERDVQAGELDAIEPPAEDDDSPPWTIAAYSGSCSGCGEEIEPDDEIRADGQGGWEGRCCEL